MPTGIFLINEKNELVELEETDFQSEDIFQELLENYPNLLSGKLINPEEPRSWLLVDREVGVPGEEDGGNRWSLDHLFLDQDGIPTLVEVKRSSDTRIRREVVGQMFDYAANAITYWPIEQIISILETRCENTNEDPEQLIRNAFDTDYETYWDQVKTNLTAGKIRMIFLADEIPIELKRIVEFVNEQMDPATVLALEIKQYKSDGLQTLVPSIYGNTSEAQKRKSSSYSRRDNWTKERFFKVLSEDAPEKEVQVARKLFNWAQQKADNIWFGKGKTRGSFVPQFFRNDIKHQAFAVWTSSEVEIYFQWYANKQPFNSKDLRLELLKKLNKITDVNIPESNITKRPTIPFTNLTDDENLNHFFTVYEWYISKIENV